MVSLSPIAARSPGAVATASISTSTATRRRSSTMPPMRRSREANRASMSKTARRRSPTPARSTVKAAILASTRRSEEHTSELQSLMRISYAVFCLKKKKNKTKDFIHDQQYIQHDNQTTNTHITHPQYQKLKQ